MECIEGEKENINLVSLQIRKTEAVMQTTTSWEMFKSHFLKFDIGASHIRKNLWTTNLY